MRVCVSVCVCVCAFVCVRGGVGGGIVESYASLCPSMAPGSRQRFAILMVCVHAECVHCVPSACVSSHSQHAVQLSMLSMVLLLLEYGAVPP